MNQNKLIDSKEYIS